jgi:hypothetical protein
MGAERCDTCALDCGPCPDPCPHDVCAIGEPLAASCSACAAAVCGVDAFCCSTQWDARCVSEAQGACGLTCGGGTCGDLMCDPSVGEDCFSCPRDCGPCMGFCGDTVCDPASGEVCDTCPVDCGPCPGGCGDGRCDGSELCFSCAPDCGTCLGRCGDGLCDHRQLEFCSTCPSDCCP